MPSCPSSFLVTFRSFSLWNVFKKHQEETGTYRAKQQLSFGDTCHEVCGTQWQEETKGKHRSRSVYLAGTFIQSDTHFWCKQWSASPTPNWQMIDRGWSVRGRRLTFLPVLCKLPHSHRITCKSITNKRSWWREMEPGHRHTKHETQNCRCQKVQMAHRHSVPAKGRLKKKKNYPSSCHRNWAELAWFGFGPSLVGESNQDSRP